MASNRGNSPAAGKYSLLEKGKVLTSSVTGKRHNYGNVGAIPKQKADKSKTFTNDITPYTVHASKMATPAENTTSIYLDLKSLKDGYLLAEFEFNQHMKQKYPDFDVDVYFIDDVCQIEVSGESGSLNNADWLQHADSFIRGLPSRTIDTSNNIDKLLFDDANNTVEIVYRFIRAKVKEIYGKYRFLLFREGSSINMYYQKQKIAHDVERVIENCFTSLVGVDICTNNGQKLVDDGKKAGKIYIEKRGDHMYNITGTIDVMEELKYPHVKYIIVQDLPRLILNYLRTYGEGILNNIYTDSHIDYTLSENSIMLYAKGSEQLKSALKDLRSAIKKLRKSIKLPSDALTDTQRADIDSHMNYLQCCWTIQPINRPEHMLENCKYVTYWYDAIDELRISVIKGNPWDINFDLQIVFTTNHLFPYMETEDSKDKEAVSRFLEHGKVVIEKKQSPFSLGDTSSLLDDVKLDLSEKTSYVVGIVVTSDQGNHRQNISSSSLKNAYGKLLIESISKNIKTVGILADVKEQASSDPCYYKDLVEVILQRNSNETNQLSDITDCVLCCIENPSHVVDELNTMFKNKRGYCQKNCSADTQMSADDVCRTVTELTVRSSPLQDEIADALVNTTNKELCLDKGKLSKNLLELAGPDLQKQCKKLYPGGLKPGQIAVTDSFDLSKKEKNKCKRIYHVALPPYKYETFRKDIGMYVQKCLCQAERDGCEKIAFPAFGVGNLKYPRREVAEAMISAADEFCSEAINLKLRKIKFAVVKEDARTAEAFYDEEWRRSKKCAKLKLRKLNVQTEFSALNVPFDRRSIQITTTSYYNGLPSYAVCCHFDEFKTKGRYLKTASNYKYPTWNDCLYLGKTKDVKSTQECLKRNHDEMKSERITLAVIYASTELNQAEQVKEIVEYFKSVTGLPKLKTVIIIVTGEKELCDVGELLKLDVSSLSKPKKSYFTIELIGEPDSLTKADDYIQTLIKPTFDKTDKRLNSSLLNKDKQDAVSTLKTVGNTSLNADHGKKDSVAQVKTKGFTDSSTNAGLNKMPHTAGGDIADARGKSPKGANKEDDCYGKKFVNVPNNTEDIDIDVSGVGHMVSGGAVDDDVCKFKCPDWDGDPVDEDFVRAQLNPGIVQMNKDSSQWKKWINEIYEDYKVKVVVENFNQNDCFAYGSLDDIMKFENHLDNLLNGFRITTIEKQGKKETVV